ncbi:hypothetical protein ACFL2V_09920 [Pseudomonadota bacterium]
MTKYKKASAAAASVLAALILAGCNDGVAVSEEEPADTSTSEATDAVDTNAEDSSTGGDSSAKPADAITLSYSIQNAIENVGHGIYRRTLSGIVAYDGGKPLPDGTKVYLNSIDSVLAQGTVDSISGSVLTDSTPTLGDGVTPIDFTTAYILRNESYKGIDAGDRVLLASFNAGAPNAAPLDKNRAVSSEEGAVTPNAITVSEAYSAAYPNSIYTAGMTDYVVGVSALGATFLGQDEEGVLVNDGYAVVKDGVIKFAYTYPANSSTIHTGCYDPLEDERSYPLGSARTYLVASAGNATVIEQGFCFASIAPWQLSPFPESIKEGVFSSQRVTFEIRDNEEEDGGGDGMLLPYTTITAKVAVVSGDPDDSGVSLDGEPVYGSEGALVLGSYIYTTDWKGEFTADITLSDDFGDGDKVMISFSGGHTTVEVPVGFSAAADAGGAE